MSEVKIYWNYLTTILGQFVYLYGHFLIVPNYHYFWYDVREAILSVAIYEVHDVAIVTPTGTSDQMQSEGRCFKLAKYQQQSQQYQQSHLLYINNL